MPKRTKRKVPSNSHKERILDRQDYQCNYCGKRLGNYGRKGGHSDKNYDFDHLRELKNGGKNYFQALCVHCHKAKTKRRLYS